MECLLAIQIENRNYIMLYYSLNNLWSGSYETLTAWNVQPSFSIASYGPAYVLIMQIEYQGKLFVLCWPIWL